ncbi:hypothetical protein OIU78_026229 [Salix suchowensis]|nr:hypothetical protein OIU78_026229 [Salix suchowensis]
MRSLSLSALTLSSSLLLLLLLLLLNTKRCRASISLPEMDGDLPLYSIADSNLDSEFMMDSEINRILSASAAAAGSSNQGLDPSKIVFKLRDSIRYGLEQKKYSVRAV